MNIKREDVLKLLVLSPRRYEHTLGTEKTALVLARTHYPFLDEEKVSVSALLHDLTKEYTVQEHISVARKYGYEFSEFELLSPKLLHSKTASYIARHELKLPDDVCDAIYYHTTGKPEMKPLETIIYFADYIEETRKDEVCVELREKYLSLLEKTEKNDALNKALVLSFDYTIVNLMEKSKIIDQNTINARNYYLLKTLTK